MTFSRTCKRHSDRFQVPKCYIKSHLHCIIIIENARLRKNANKLSIKLLCHYLVQHVLHQIKAQQNLY